MEIRSLYRRGGRWETRTRQPCQSLWSDCCPAGNKLGNPLSIARIFISVSLHHLKALEINSRERLRVHRLFPPSFFVETPDEIFELPR